MTQAIGDIAPQGVQTRDHAAPDKPRRRALILGASSGIGAATAVSLAERGWHVLAAARREDRLAELAKEHSGICTAVVDVSDTAAVRSLVESSEPLDALVYAAGWNLPDREIKVLAEEDWKRSFSVNVDGAFAATQAVLPQMREAGGGVIVYVSSISAEKVDASGVAYQASKRALNGLAEVTSLEEGHYGIRTSLVMPGLTATEFMGRRRVPPTAEQRATFMSAEDVADAIAYICELPPRLMIPSLTIVPTVNPWNR